MKRKLVMTSQVGNEFCHDPVDDVGLYFFEKRQFYWKLMTISACSHLPPDKKKTLLTGYFEPLIVRDFIYKAVYSVSENFVSFFA